MRGKTSRGGRGVGKTTPSHHRGSRFVYLMAWAIILGEVFWRCFTIVNHAFTQNGEQRAAESVVPSLSNDKDRQSNTTDISPPPDGRNEGAEGTAAESTKDDVDDDDDDDDDSVVRSPLVRAENALASTSMLELAPLRRMDVYPVELLRGLEDGRETWDGWHEGRGSSPEVSFDRPEPPPRCITVRASRANITFAELRRPLRVGIEFVENVNHFTSRAGRSGVFHFYHFVEFMVAAVTELYSATSAQVSRRGNRLGPDFFGGPLEIPWIYSPHLAREEMMGVRGLNWLVAQVTLNGCLDGSPLFHSQLMGEEVNATLKLQWDLADQEQAYPVQRRRHWNNVPSSSCRSTAFRGLESNDDGVRSLHGAYNRTMEGVRQHPKARRYDRPPHDLREMNQREMVSAVDAILLLNRDACHGGAINKMWFGFLDDFPAQIWHSHIVHALDGWKRHLQHEDGDNDDKKDETFTDKGCVHHVDDNAFVITYIDRQDSLRTMPLQDHEWIVSTFSQWAATQPQVVFQQVIMEQLDHYQQLACAAQSHVLMGVHGNGLTHQLWMPPQSAIVEIFWQYPFQYDYGTMARLLRHDYISVMNGVVLSPTRIQQLDPEMLHVPHDLNGTDGHFLPDTQRQLQQFVQQALDHKRPPKKTKKTTTTNRPKAKEKKKTRKTIVTDNDPQTQQR